MLPLCADTHQGDLAITFLNLNIRGRLILGFSMLCALLAIVVGATIVKVRAVNEFQGVRTVNLRVPTAMTASDVVAGVYASLASLRGWMITGNDKFKAERATLWKEIQRYGSRMDSLSSHWTAEQNKADWKQAKPLLDELRTRRTSPKRSHTRSTNSRPPKCWPPRRRHWQAYVAEGNLDHRQ